MLSSTLKFVTGAITAISNFILLPFKEKINFSDDIFKLIFRYTHMTTYNDPLFNEFLARIDKYKSLKGTKSYTESKYHIHLPEYDHSNNLEPMVKYINLLERNFKSNGYETELNIKENTYSQEELKKYKDSNMEVPPTTFSRKLIVKWF